MESNITHLLAVMFAVLMFSGWQNVGVTATMETYQLVTHLMSNYSKMVRPVRKGSDTVDVQYDIALQQIIDMDERNQILLTNVWLRQFWTDVHFQWDPEDYGGVKNIRVASPNIWKPDVVLYNNADDKFEGIMKTNADIDYTGAVKWYAPALFKSSCKVNIRYFPFDTQYCDLRLGSWTFAASGLNLMNVSDSGDSAAFIKNGEWTLKGMPITREFIYYPCCPDDPYNVLTFTIIIQRRPLFYVFNLIVPGMLVSALTALDFYLSAESGEKITLSITILLSLSVFLLLVAETLPPTSEVIPLISAYYMATMVLVSVSMFFSVIVLALHHRGCQGRRAPKLLRVITFEYIAPVLLCRRGCKNSQKKDKKLKYKLDGSLQELNPDVLEQNFLEMAENKNQVYGGKRATVQSNLDGIAKNLQHLVQKSDDNDADNEIINEWKEVALIIDRLFMLIFGVTTVISTIAIIFQAPSLK
ncbi:acetylcholine receptor subunit alpha-1-A-like [Glandiceps talaboti]